ncbi:hypothetical protein NBRC13296_12160 [Paenibacillus chitinolyticus]|uniref:hypothetical protein n=1 Tax=Paenibacillus chitinolyticus TaxID=79263 RepID=UPI00355627D4
MANRKLTDKTMVSVFNNNGGVVFYYSELNRVKRRWDKPNVDKKISLEELKELVNTAGGYELLRDDLLITDIDVREELGLPVEKEYMLDDQGIKELLGRSQEDLEEVLSNASDAIKEKIAHVAILIQLADLNKIEVIKANTGIDILSAIQQGKEDQKTGVKTK